MPQCKQCQNEFKITPQAKELLARFEVPDPKLCPYCRMQRRQNFRNERTLYNRKCDLTGEKIVSLFADDRPFTVYSQDAWWSDKWSPPKADFDFSRPFFEQFRELQLKAPRMALLSKESDNSEYMNHSAKNKDCYIGFSVVHCEKVFYAMMVEKGEYLVDVTYCYDHCNLCYEAFHCYRCYGCIYATECRGCTDCKFIYDCSGCTNCFLCWNLRNKEYCFMNEQLTEEEYNKKIEKYKILKHEDKLKLIEQWEDIKNNKAIHKDSRQINCTNCTGDYIVNANNCHDVFHLFEGENSAYLFHCWHIKEGMDLSNNSTAEFSYETHGIVNASHIKFVNYSYDNSFIEYCDHVFDSEHCFGCVGLKKGKYRILNKQYEEDDYKKLKAKIIEHMKKTGEYGEFFPYSLSPFAYNETIANELFPLKKEQTLKLGSEWRDAEKQLAIPEDSILAKDLPAIIDEVKDDILDKFIICEQTQKPFKLQKQELEIYRQLKVPVPHLHPDVRYENRLKQRTSIYFSNVRCSKCDKEVRTTYDKDSKVKTIYCEQCYNEKIY